jgi:hypothetical protein
VTRPPLALRFTTAGAAAILFVVAAMTKADSDLWGHLRFGLDTLHTHTLPSVDPYSFTQDRPWVNHEWLSELQMGIAYALAGVTGLTLLKGALAFATLFLVWRALAGTDVAARIVLVAVAALSTAPLTRTLRPQLWSMVCLAILCSVLLSNRRQRAWWLPLLFLIWANVHGGWIVGLGILGVWAGVDVVLDRRSLWRWTSVLLLSILATLATPYGLGLWHFLDETVGMGRNITEWQPLWTAPVSNWIPWIATVAFTAWLLRTGDRSRWRVVAVSIMLAYASARVMRLWPLYIEVAVMLLAPSIRAKWPRRASATFGATREEAVAGAVILAGCLTGAAWLGSSAFRCIAVDGDWTPDVVAAAALDGHQPGRLVVFFDWGEYALWHWGPSLLVSMDGRRETVYSDARLREHQDILDATPAGQRVLEDSHAAYVWLPASSTRTAAWLEAHGYRIEVRTSKSFVAVRADLLPLPQPPPGPRACFPG